MIADRDSTKKLISPEFFMVSREADVSVLTGVCLSLKKLLEPEKPFYPSFRLE